MNQHELEQFWSEDEKAHENNCFNNAPQAPLGIRMSDECVFAELGEPGNPWDETPRERRIELNKRYNDKAEKIVGKRLLQEDFLPDDARFPYVKRIGEVFGSKYIMHNHTEWLCDCIHSEEELEQTLDRVEKMDLRAFMYPDNWESEKKRIFEQYGLRPRPNHHIRGPVTLACSLMDTTNFLYFMMDESELAERFSAVIADTIIRMAEIQDEEAGFQPGENRGFSFADDNCCLMTPDMYELFGYPVLKKVFGHFAPDPEDKRYQHSDSDMAHILPFLGKLNLNGCNFGPNVLTPEIRKYLPNCRIDGCIAPLTFMRNETEELKKQLLRDIHDHFEFGGVNISTAGSINNGSSLESMRLMMDILWDNHR